MKKLASLILALVMVLSVICMTAYAEDIPQPEGGRKFESNWAKMCGLVDVTYEEEGYRVSVDLFNQADNTGTLWQYSCYYNEEKDVLESISSSKASYTIDMMTMDKTLGENEYEGIDGLEDTTVFSLSADGVLSWADGHENLGQDLEFRDIGRFEGVWENEAEDIYTEIWWRGLYDENTYCYAVFVYDGGVDQNTNYDLQGLYNTENGKLTVSGTSATTIRATEGANETEGEAKPCEASFSLLENGNLLFEGEHAIELVYNILGPES